FSLVLRSYQGAFWLTLLSPFAIAVVLIFPILLSSIPVVPNAYWGFVSFVTFAYGIILGVLARRQFLNWQDLGQWGGDIWFSPRSTQSSIENPRKQIRRYRPLFGLARKELSLQQLNLVVAFALLVLYVAGAGIYNPATQSPGEAALLAGFARALLLVFLPLAIGAISISEERRLKVDQWQQVLPSSSRYQWLVKVGMVYLVTAVSTILAPLAFDSLFQEFWSRVAIETKTLKWIAIVVPFLAATLGLYASSLSNSYLVALGSSMVVSLLGLGAYYLGVEAILSAIVPNGMAFPQLLFVSLLLLLGLPLLWALSFYNYRTVRSLKPLIASNGASWLAIFAICVLATQLIYSRAWERFTYRVPNAGKPMETQEVQPTIIPGTWVTVLAPDGTLWTSQHHHILSLNDERKNQLMVRLGERAEWTSAFSSLRNFYSVKRNGALYRTPIWNGESLQPKLVPDPQPGTTWQNVIGGLGDTPVIAIKSDGSLWQWMENEDRSISNPIPYLPDTRWRSVAREGHFYVGIRIDKSMWAWGVKSGFTRSTSILQNPLSTKISNEVNLLFPPNGLPDLENETVIGIIDEFGPLLERLNIDITDLEGPDARSRYTRARFDEEKAEETPYQVGIQTDWNSVRFSGRIVLKQFYDNNETLLNNILIGTRSDGSIWAPTEGTPMPWRV
ncbi:ABC transporter permease, partial [Verrucomicrobia bacterium]|nr:ABC transporter permease [Verrucomicrobiota bacterium]